LIDSMNRVSLSVVVPTRNREAVIGRAVASVLADRRPDLEVVVVDDGSTDRTQAVLSAVGDGRLLVHRLESAGNANRARNVGARLSHGPLVAFLDSDDCFAAGRVERLIAFFAANPQVDCLVDGYMEFSHGGPRVHAMPPIKPDPVRMRRLLLAHALPLTNSAISLRRSAFEALGGYDEGMPRHQDRELLLRLARSHTIWLGNVADVEKHRVDRSLSHDHDGYIAGLDALAARCPDYFLPENADLVRYLVSRGILKALTTGHWGAAFREFNSWRHAEHLPKDYLRCLGAYRSGRLRRIRIREDR
jgi:glycosyltransferase involved in cell wall biosynthesis